MACCRRWGARPVSDRIAALVRSDIAPAANVDNYETEDTRIRCLSDDELKIVLAIENPFVVDVRRATLETLSRISELLALRREHIGASWIEFSATQPRCRRPRALQVIST